MAKYINNSKFANWSKTNSCTPRYYDKPKTLFEIRKAIEFCKLNNVKMRICGSVTSPSDITMTDEFLLDTRGLDKIVSVDTTTSKSVLQSGVLLKDFVKTLSEKYFAAFPTLPSIMEQTIGGLLSTSSHGTGYAISSFSRYVSKMRIVDSNGELKVLRKDTDLFYAASTGLGLFGVIFDIELDIEKLFYLKSKQKSVETDFFYKNMIELAEKNEYFRAWTIPHINKTVIWEAEKIQYRSDLGDIRKFESF
ncbi:D-arabinono-1,4-lactone oxidase [Bonamia ostreae]|uniref:D-arabinono-1,4-lactone oxidase n=1 Tax=Bonamia ostreae TaxID=126728 RepID=A0ABV2ANM9_9EUKA